MSNDKKILADFLASMARSEVLKDLATSEDAEVSRCAIETIISLYQLRYKLLNPPVEQKGGKNG